MYAYSPLAPTLPCLYVVTLLALMLLVAVVVVLVLVVRNPKVRSLILGRICPSTLPLFPTHFFLHLDAAYTIQAVCLCACCLCALFRLGPVFGVHHGHAQYAFVACLMTCSPVSLLSFPYLYPLWSFRHSELAVICRLTDC
jgi:hypothetical protein